MAYQQKPGQGSLFINNRKQQDNHPDFTGSLTLLDGTECWLSCWDKGESERGPRFSLSIKPKEASGTQPWGRTSQQQRPAQSRPSPTAPPADGDGSGVHF